MRRSVAEWRLHGGLPLIGLPDHGSVANYGLNPQKGTHRQGVF
jgi:hypothetical protein